MVRRISAKLVLQLRAEGMTGRAIALAQGMSRKSVLAVFDAAEKAGGIGSDGHGGRTEAEVYALLFPGRGEHESVFVQPGWDGVHKVSIRAAEPHPIVRLSPTKRTEEHQWRCGSTPLALPVMIYAVA